MSKRLAETEADAILTPEPLPMDDVADNPPLARKLDEATARERKRRQTVPKPPSGVDLSAFASDGDLVDIWERRMINPDQRQTKPIRVHTPGLHLRWINLSSNGRYQRARYDEGWVPVLKIELVDEREIYGVSYTTEGYVCRGEKQQEMLMKIPLAVWKKIRARKVELVRQSQQSIKERMQSAGATHFSDKYNTSVGNQVADTLGTFKGDIKFGIDQVEPESGDLSVETDAQ